MSGLAMHTRWYRSAAIIGCLLLLLPGEGIAREGSAGRAGAFLRMGLGARARAMGNAQAAAVQDGLGAYYNPAALADLDGQYVNLSKMFLSLDRTFNVAGYARPIPPTAGLSLMWINAGVGKIDGRDMNGEQTGNIDYSENAYYLSFANRVSPWVSLGVTIKLMTQQLHELSAKGFGFDVGLLANPMDNLQIGLMVKDIRSGYNWNSDDIYERGSSIENRFPVTVRGGFAWRVPKYSTLLAVDVDKQTSGDAELHVGVEQQIMHRLALRAGLDGGDLAGGFGVIFPIAGLESRIDYSMANDDNDPELSQILSWVIRF